MVITETKECPLPAFMEIGDFIINGTYKLVRRLGFGSFGYVFLAEDLKSGEEIAIKIESVKTHRPQLVWESKVIQALSATGGFPAYRDFGVEEEYSYLVMDLLGRSLEDLFDACGHRFSMKTIVMLGFQMLSKIEQMHERHLIHRDIKPSNFLIGTGEHSKDIYLVDFGLSKRYRDPATLKHIPFREKKQFTGTAKFASLNAHQNVELSRRDDIEMLSYVLMYFSKGYLPWHSIKADNKAEKYAKIKELKAIPIHRLFKGYPCELTTLLQYARSMTFQEQPNYSYIRVLLKAIKVEDHLADDYDWDLENRTLSPALNPSPIGISIAL